MADAGNWCLIESDPGVFTELIKDFGVNGVQVEELYTLEPEMFTGLKPVLGLIFLFKWVPEAASGGEPTQDYHALDNIFFAKQVINNACATQAILSVLLNSSHPDIKLGSTLDDFKSFCQNFDPQMKGLALSNSDVIRDVHNSFSRQAIFEFDSKSAGKNDSVYHFVSYIPYNGCLYELDGLKEGPIKIGTYESSTDWVESVVPVIKKRMEKYSEGEIHFNLMAVVTDRKTMYLNKIAQVEEAIGSGIKSDSQYAELDFLKSMVKEEEEKFDRYRIENIRRKHNYLPLIVELLKILAKEKRLYPLYLKAKARAEEIAKNKSKKLMP